MKRPANFAYWLDDVPPIWITLVAALQHIGLVCAFFSIPLAIAREAGLSAGGLTDLIGVSMLALGVGTILQSLRRGPVGSGFLAPSCFSGVYLAPALLAARDGGMALVLGMTMFGGFVEVVLSRLVKFLRPYFPPEIAGLVVVLVGIDVGSLGIKYILGTGGQAPASERELAVSAVTLALMAGLVIWTRGAPRLFCALLGMIGGYAAAALLGVLTTADVTRALNAPIAALPAIGSVGWSFDYLLIFPFLLVAMVSCLKTVGDLTMAQRINDAEWQHPDLESAAGGTLAVGIGSVLAGFLGTVGMTTSSANIGVSGATAVTSRRVGLFIGALLIVLAFIPRLSGLLAAMPRSVMGAARVFVATFIFVTGLQVIASRMLDRRRAFVIGMAFIVAIAFGISPEFFRSVPIELRPLFSSSLVAGMVAAVLLNLLFRIGARKTGQLVVSAGDPDQDAIERFVETCGASWGAQRDVVMRAKFNIQQTLDTISSSGVARSPIDLDVSFDELDVEVRLQYQGSVLEMPEKRPTVEEVLDTASGERKLAGFMLRQMASSVSASQSEGRATLLFKFAH